VNIGDFSHRRFFPKYNFAKKSEQNLSPIVSKKVTFCFMTEIPNEFLKINKRLESFTGWCHHNFMADVISISSGKSGLVRRKLKIRRARSAAELRRGLRLKAAPHYKIHDYLTLTNGLKSVTGRKLKVAAPGKLAVHTAAVGW
jgi:hypothetical protein